jgi:hypothetical protein
MELLDRHQAARKQPTLHRQNDVITRYQPKQCVIGPVFPSHCLDLRTAFPWAIFIVATVIAIALATQDSVIEATLRAAVILIRCIHRLSIDGERILSELIADWHSINASFD